MAQMTDCSPSPDRPGRSLRPSSVLRRAFLGILPLSLGWWPPRTRSEDQDAAKRAPGTDALARAVGALVRDSGAEDVGVAFHDLATHDGLLIRPDTTFHAASTMKVPVMMEVFRQA
jgi:hypothetical protein